MPEALTPDDRPVTHRELEARLKVDRPPELPLIDPTANVLSLVAGAMQRQDDLRAAEASHRDAISAIRDRYGRELREQAGAISAQDLRDLIMTLRSGAGEISIATPAPTVVADMTTWLPVAGTWALTAESEGWDNPTLGRLRYLGAAARMVHIAASIEIDLATGSTETVQLGIGKNGTVLGPSITQQHVDSAGGLGHESTALHGFTMVETNDYLEIVVRNITSLDDLNVDFANLFAMDMAI